MLAGLERPAGPVTHDEQRTERLGFALRRLAAELVEERRKVAELRREVGTLSCQLAQARRQRAPAQSE